MTNRYGNFLTMVLVVLIVAIIGILGFVVYSRVNSNAINSNADAATDEFERKIVKREKKEDTEETDNDGVDISAELAEKYGNSSRRRTEKQAEKTYMEGYEVKGVIEIPKTDVKYPVLSDVTKRSLEIAVGIAYGPGLNEVGNTCIYGHNYRNGLFFSNNKKLSKGDKVYITDQYGDKVTYSIYNIYETTPNDATYMTRDTEGRREISLQTCTDDSSGRIIIWAMEEPSKNNNKEETQETSQNGESGNSEATENVNE